MAPNRIPTSADVLPSSHSNEPSDDRGPESLDIAAAAAGTPSAADVLAHVSLPVFVTSPAGQMTYVNDAAARLMGVTEATPLPIDVRVFYTDVSLRDVVITALRRGDNPVVAEGDFVALNGRVNHGRTVIKPVWRAPGDLAYIVCTIVEHRELQPEPETKGYRHTLSTDTRAFSLGIDRSATSSDAALVIDLDSLTIHEANLPAALLFAVPRHRLLGRALTRYIDESTLRPHIDRLRATGQVAISDLTITDADGAPINTEGHAAVSVNSGGERRHAVLMLRATDWVTATQASLRLVTDALEQTVEAVALLTPDGRVRFANRALGQLLGVDSSKLVARHIGELDLTRDGEPLSEATLAPAWTGRLQGRRLDGQPVAFVAHASFTPLYDDVNAPAGDGSTARRRLLGTIAVVRDVTAELELQRKLLQNEKLAAVGTLVEGATHELNNQLAPVLGFAQLLAEEPGLSPSARQSAEEIQEAARACRRILTGLLDFAATKPEHVELLDWRDAIDQVLAVYRPEIERLGIQLAATGRGVPIRVSRERIKVVVFNLIKNAMEAVKPHTGRIDVTLSASGEQAVLQICDNGPGFPADVLPRVFDPFFTTKGDQRSAGLGLSTCYGIVTDAGGSMRAEDGGGDASCPGARVIVTLPLASADATVPTAERERTASSGMRYTGARVLVVDDERAMVQLLTRMLEPRGLQVHGTTDPFEALALNDRFNLVITDIRMPQLGGRKLYARMRLRQSEIAPGEPGPAFLFVTGDTASTADLQDLVSDRSDVIAKPFDVPALLAVVERLLDADVAGSTPAFRDSDAHPTIDVGDAGNAETSL